MIREATEHPLAISITFNFDSDFVSVYVQTFVLHN